MKQRDDKDLSQNSTQQQQGSNPPPATKAPRQQQQDTGKQPVPGGGEPEVQEDIRSGDTAGDRDSRGPIVDVERE